MKFKLTQAFIQAHVLVIPRRMKFNQKMKALSGHNVSTIVKSTGIFPDTWAAKSLVSGGMWLKFKHIQDLMIDLVTCKNEEDTARSDQGLWS